MIRSMVLFAVFLFSLNLMGCQGSESGGDSVSAESSGDNALDNIRAVNRIELVSAIEDNE